MLKSFLRRFLALGVASIMLFGLVTFNVASDRQFLGVEVVNAQDEYEEVLATSPSECYSRDVLVDGKFIHTTPKNCFFLEEPIGGDPGYDLYTVGCVEGQKEGEETICVYSLWHGGAITGEVHGPVQALLTYEPDKPYQGPFGLLYSYLGLVYGYMSGIIVGIVVLFIVIGGVQMITSAGDESKYNEGKQRIIKALIGLALWFTASLILYTINPTFFAF
jgi:hypothetical protein